MAQSDELIVRASRFGDLLARGAVLAMGAHCLFGVVFLAIGEALLAGVNVLSLCTYAAGIWLVRRGHIATVLALTWAEVIGHAVLAVWRLGWGSGFHLYVFVLLGLIFVGPSEGGRRSAAVAAAAALWALYAAFDYLMGGWTGVGGHDPTLLALLRYFNLASMFVLLGYLWLYFSDSVHAAEQRLLEMAGTDALSGLGNRRQAGQAMHEAIEQAGRTGQAACLILADLDDFKRLNDTHGHDAGDRAIVQVSQQLRAACRKSDQVCRWGGEEFLVVLPRTGLDEARAVAQRIHAAAGAHALQVGAQPVRITLTLGVAAHVPGESVEQWVARADRALYRGKTAGKNRTELALAA